MPGRAPHFSRLLREVGFSGRAKPFGHYRFSGVGEQVNLVVKWISQSQYRSRHFAKFQQAESLASTLPGGLNMRGHIPFQQDLTVALFAVMFVIMLLLVLAAIPLVNYLVNYWFPGI
jgi:hypothetical protein